MPRPAQRCPCAFGACSGTVPPNIVSIWSCRTRCAWAALALCCSPSAALRAIPSLIILTSMAIMSWGVFLQVGHVSVDRDVCRIVQVASMQHLWNLWRHGRMSSGTSLSLSARASSGSSFRGPWQIAHVSSSSVGPGALGGASPPPWGSSESVTTVGASLPPWGTSASAASIGASPSPWGSSASAASIGASPPPWSGTGTLASATVGSSIASSVASRPSAGSCSFHDMANAAAERNMPLSELQVWDGGPD